MLLVFKIGKYNIYRFNQYWSIIQNAHKNYKTQLTTNKKISNP